MVAKFRSLLAVDAEGFSRNRDADLPVLHTEIRRAMGCACERSGLESRWRAARFLQSTGDGLLAVLPEEASVPLVHPFTGHLQDVLAELAPQLRTRRLQLRLRIALHAGIVDDEHPTTPGISSATNNVCRLLDCEPLKAALRDSDPGVTFAAVIASEEMFDMYVRGGHTALQPSQFRQVQATVKQFDRRAYLYVPVPSESEHPDHPSRNETKGPPTTGPAGDLSLGNVSVTGHHAQNIIGNQVGGSIRQERR